MGEMDQFMPRVHIQAPLTQATDGNADIVMDGRTIHDIIEGIERRWGGLKRLILNERGSLLRHVLVSVNGEDIRFLEDFETPVGEDDEVTIVPMISGG
jgi:molybdopterin converting factor small subunit